MLMTKVRMMVVIVIRARRRVSDIELGNFALTADVINQEICKNFHKCPVTILVWTFRK